MRRGGGGKDRGGLKGKVGVGGMGGEERVVELWEELDVEGKEMKEWKEEVVEGGRGVSGDERKGEGWGGRMDVKRVEGKMGEVRVEKDFLWGGVGKGGLVGGKK